MKFILSSPAVRERVAQFIRDVPQGYHVTIKPSGRSIDQNSIFHALCMEYGRLKGEEPETIKNAMKYFAFGVLEIEVEGKVLQSLKESSKCDKKEMSHLIDTTYRKAAEEGYILIYTGEENDIATR